MGIYNWNYRIFVLDCIVNNNFKEMKELEIIQGLNEQRKNNISKAFDKSTPNKYFEKLDENMSKSEAFEIIQKAFEDGKISEGEFEKAVRSNHKYIRKEGNRYIYKENEIKDKMKNTQSEDEKVEDLESMKSQIFSSSSNWGDNSKSKLNNAIKNRINELNGKN